MSEIESDGRISSIASKAEQSTNSELTTSPLALSDLSPGDKPWDKHRAFADRVQTHYQGTEFQRYSDRVTFCSQILEFGFKFRENETLGIKLRSARFCRVRHCPICQWRRSLRWKAKAFQVLPKLVDNHPTHRWLFVTHTVRNCQITELRDTLKQMNKGYQKMSRRKIWPAEGWIRSTEVTRGVDGSAHPHFHSLLLVPAGYFGHKYVKHSEWRELWRDCMGLDYTPVMDVRAVKQGDTPMQLVPEMLKYLVKESDMVADREWFLELTRQLHNMRSVATGGILKKYLQDLEHEPDDLIGEGNEEDAGFGSIYFGWHPWDKRYRLKD